MLRYRSRFRSILSLHFNLCDFLLILFLCLFFSFFRSFVFFFRDFFFRLSFFLLYLRLISRLLFFIFGCILLDKVSRLGNLFTESYFLIYSRPRARLDIGSFFFQFGLLCFFNRLLFQSLLLMTFFILLSLFFSFIGQFG